MDGSAVHLETVVMYNRIMWEVQNQIFYTRCSKEISFINEALLRHYYRTKRMTILKFELHFRMQCVRSPWMDGMIDTVVSASGIVYVWWCAVCTECKRHATLALCLVLMLSRTYVLVRTRHSSSILNRLAQPSWVWGDLSSTGWYRVPE